MLQHSRGLRLNLTNSSISPGRDGRGAGAGGQNLASRRSSMGKCNQTTNLDSKREKAAIGSAGAGQYAGPGSRLLLHSRKWRKRLGRSFYASCISGLNASSGDDDGKHAASELWHVGAAACHPLSQAFLETVDQGTWCAKACQFDDGRFPQIHLGPERQVLELQSGRCDVLTQIPGANRMPSFA
jgi:hypothetical protein